LSSVLIVAAFAAAPGVAAAAEEPLPAQVRFNRDIRPILSDTCYACHGPDAKHRKAKLRLDLELDAKAVRENGKAIIPGNLEKSLVWKLISSTDAEERMPPAKSNKSLTARLIALIKKWIEK